MSDAEALVTIFGMIAGVLVTWGIAWGVVRGIREWRGAGVPDRALENAVDAMRDQLGQMQQQLLDAHERIDFTERLLAQSRAPEQLPRGTE